MLCSLHSLPLLHGRLLLFVAAVTVAAQRLETLPHFNIVLIVGVCPFLTPPLEIGGLGLVHDIEVFFEPGFEPILPAHLLNIGVPLILREFEVAEDLPWRRLVEPISSLVILRVAVAVDEHLVGLVVVELDLLDLDLEVFGVVAIGVELEHEQVGHQRQVVVIGVHIDRGLPHVHENSCTQYGLGGVVFGLLDHWHGLVRVQLVVELCVDPVVVFLLDVQLLTIKHHRLFHKILCAGPHQQLELLLIEA